VFEIRKTVEFSEWLESLRDTRGRARILVRIERLSAGHFGDAKVVGQSVAELRIDVGPGYRVYFVRQGQTVIVLLAGGDKSTQATDIRKAQRLANNL
jgi:putative addiction module killer protein